MTPEEKQEKARLGREQSRIFMRQNPDYKPCERFAQAIHDVIVREKRDWTASNLEYAWRRVKGKPYLTAKDVVMLREMGIGLG
jgi:hypothetical protein